MPAEVFLCLSSSGSYHPFQPGLKRLLRRALCWPCKPCFKGCSRDRMGRLRVLHPDINRDVVSKALVDVQRLEPKHSRLIERFCGYLGRMSDALIVLVGNDARAEVAHGMSLSNFAF